MSIVCIGVNHRSAPLDLLERLAVVPPDRAKALARLVTADHLSEAVLLSTCNRLEIYAVAERFHGGFGEIQDFFAETADMPRHGVVDHVYALHDEAAVRHLFRVAAGLDSVVVGEHEILGQVKQAWEDARLEQAAGPSLNLVFRHAVEVGKRARTETGIARSSASVSSAAVSMASDRLGGLNGRRALVLGAGEMGEGIVVALVAAGADRIHIANRTVQRAAGLAARVGGDVAELSDVPRLLGEVDLLVTCTGASSVLVEHVDLGETARSRSGRPLLIVDIAVPRDVDHAVGELDAVTLLDMDDLTTFAEAGRQERAQEVTAVEAIIDAEVARFADVRSARQLDPLITALRGLGEAVRLSELDRYRTTLAGLDPAQREVVDAVTRGLVNKLLHSPTVQVKEAAGTLKGDRLADSLRELFDL